jgi:hypothetical protein
MELDESILETASEPVHIAEALEELIILLIRRSVTNSLVEHAKKELALTDHDEEFKQCIIKAIESFTSYGHSGGSIGIGITTLVDLILCRNLTPLTDDPDEWMFLDDDVWQSTRRADAFSYDGGHRYHIIGDRNVFIESIHKEK